MTSWWSVSIKKGRFKQQKCWYNENIIELIFDTLHSAFVFFLMTEVTTKNRQHVFDLKESTGD